MIPTTNAQDQQPHLRTIDLPHNPWSYLKKGIATINGHNHNHEKSPHLRTMLNLDRATGLVRQFRAIEGWEPFNYYFLYPGD